ncbi:MAG: hypothetical protein GWO02_03840, partial [Gammaproteobacteria bacterium]|nr:hypothetical protein [Gammaproteobacteria bacterium]
PIVFDVPGQARGEARAAELSVVERRMTLIDYTVSDPGGNRMRGRKLTLTFR